MKQLKNKAYWFHYISISLSEEFCDSLIRFVFLETTPPTLLLLSKKNVIFIHFYKDLQSKILVFQVFKSQYKRRMRRPFMFLSLNRRKHEMCEKVLKCFRELDHYGRRSMYSAIYFLQMYAKSNNKKKTWHTSHLSPKRRKTIPPYVENDSPALPLGHIVVSMSSTKKFTNRTRCSFA